MPAILWKSFLWICIVCAGLVVCMAIYEATSSAYNELRTSWKLPSTHDPALAGTWTTTPENKKEPRIVRFQANGEGTITFPHGGTMPFNWGSEDGAITIRYRGHHGHLAPTYPYKIHGKSMTFVGARQAYGRILRDYVRVD